MRGKEILAVIIINRVVVLLLLVFLLFRTSSASKGNEVVGKARINQRGWNPIGNFSHMSHNHHHHYHAVEDGDNRSNGNNNNNITPSSSSSTLKNSRYTYIQPQRTFHKKGISRFSREKSSRILNLGSGTSISNISFHSFLFPSTPSSSPSTKQITDGVVVEDDSSSKTASKNSSYLKSTKNLINSNRHPQQQQKLGSKVLVKRSASSSFSPSTTTTTTRSSTACILRNMALWKKHGDNAQMVLTGRVEDVMLLHEPHSGVSRSIINSVVTSGTTAKSRSTTVINDDSDNDKTTSSYENINRENEGNLQHSHVETVKSNTTTTTTTEKTMPSSSSGGKRADDDDHGVFDDILSTADSDNDEYEFVHRGYTVTVHVPLPSQPATFTTEPITSFAGFGDDDHDTTTTADMNNIAVFSENMEETTTTMITRSDNKDNGDRDDKNLSASLLLHPLDKKEPVVVAEEEAKEKERGENSEEIAITTEGENVAYILSEDREHNSKNERLAERRRKRQVEEQLDKYRLAEDALAVKIIDGNSQSDNGQLKSNGMRDGSEGIHHKIIDRDHQQNISVEKNFGKKYSRFSPEFWKGMQEKLRKRKMQKGPSPKPYGSGGGLLSAENVWQKRGGNDTGNNDNNQEKELSGRYAVIVRVKRVIRGDRALENTAIIIDGFGYQKERRKAGSFFNSVGCGGSHRKRFALGGGEESAYYSAVRGDTKIFILDVDSYKRITLAAQPLPVTLRNLRRIDESSEEIRKPKGKK